MTNFITDDLINANVRSKWYSGTSTTTGASGTPIDFDTEHTGMVAVGNWVNDGAGTITIPANGTYRFTVNIAASTNINVFTAINIYKNAAASGVVAKGTSTGNNSQVWNGTISLDCEKDDEIYISHNDPGGFDFDNSINETYFEIQRIADYSAGEPAGFGLATETQAGLVKAQSRYCYMGHGVNQGTISDSQQTIVEYSTVVEDVHGMADTINHRIIPNLPGIYFCSARVFHLVNGTNFVSSSAQIRKNAATFASSGNVFNTIGNSINNVTGAALVMAGAQVFNGTTDYIDVNVACDVVNGGPTWEFPDGGTGNTYLQAVYIGPLPSLT